MTENTIINVAQVIAETFFPLLRSGRCDNDCGNCDSFAECKIAESKTTETIASIIELEWQRKIEAALDYASKYGAIDGAHHKQWVLAQKCRALLGDDYDEWVGQIDCCNGLFEWDEGIPP